jgi:predicted phage tail protein
MTGKNIRGSGGPPPTPPAPYRAPDTLNSRQFATIQDLISEGEIEGFATASKENRTKGSTAYNNAALKDVFLNETPILKSTANSVSPNDADFNFQNVSFTPRFGTANQTSIPGIVSSESTTAVGVTVSSSSAVTRQITNTNVDAIKVTITFPQLQEAKDNGDLVGSSVSLKIQVQYNSGGYSDVISDTITGRTADAYQKEYRVNVTGAFPVDIRVVRVTADSTSSSLIDAFTWTSFGEIIDDAQTYPNSAYTSLRIDSEQFSSIPKRAFRIRGVKVRIPGAGASGSGTPTVDNATGRIIYPANYIFNGTMGAAVWCSCPSMVLLDLLTTERYGFGTHIADANLDLFSFVAASKYANELVSDGQGGQEARFSCNVNIQSSKEAFDLIKDLATVMRCIAIWSTGSITITQDRPTDSSYLFSLANVTSDGFSYTGSSLKQRHSVVSVSYFNMDSREMDFEIVEDTSLQSKIGVVKKDVKAFACTSRGQAQRLGKAIIFSENQESEVVNFSTSMDAGAIVRPGSVITINDPVRGGARRSGRVAAATTTQITVDDEQGLDTFGGSNQKISVIMPDGSIETKPITGISGLVITLSSALSTTPNVNTIWLLESDSLVGQTFRVVSVEEQDGINYSISALTYVAGKYANIEQGISLPARNISLLNEPKNPPSNLSAAERTVVINALAVTKLILTWVGVTGVSQYLVQYRFNNTNWVSEIVFRTDFELLNTEAGVYEFRVFSYNAALILSATSTDLTFNAQGKTTPPSNVQNLSMEPITNQLVRLRWNKSTDADVIHGGRVYVRHSNLTDGSGTFQNSVDLITALAGNTTDAVVPSLEGEYILKFQDDGGRFSQGETSIIMDLPDLIDTQSILTQREDLLSTPFSGTKTNTTFSNTASALQLTNPASNSTGEYAFASIVDLGNVFSLNLKRTLRAVGFNIGSDIETLIPAGSFWDDYATDNNFDGAAADEANTQIQVATSQTASGSFGSFNNFANGTFKGRRFKFKLILETTNTAQNMNVQQAGFVAEFQSRTEQNYQTGGTTSTAPQSSGTSSSGKTVTFGTPFFVGTSSLGGANAYLPSVGITIQNAQSGDFFTVTNVSGTGFTVTIKNGSSFVDRTFTFSAVGYGKGV